MIKLSDNSIRLKFYKSDLPRTYSVINTGISINEIGNNFMIIGTEMYSNNQVMEHYGKLNFIKGTSFSVFDEDLFLTTVRVFIGYDGFIYLGKVYDDIDIIQSVEVFISFYINGLLKTIDSRINSRLSMSPIGSSVDWINIDLINKLINMSIKEPIRRSARRSSRYHTYADHKSIVKMEDRFHIVKDTIDISKSMFVSSKQSYTEYLEYINSDE